MYITLSRRQKYLNTFEPTTKCKIDVYIIFDAIIVDRV